MLLFSILSTALIVLFYRSCSKNVEKANLEYPNIRRVRALFYHFVLAILLCLCVIFTCVPWINEDQFWDLITLRLFHKSTDSMPAAISLLSIAIGIVSMIFNAFAIFMTIAETNVACYKYVILILVALLSICKCSELVNFFVADSVGEPGYVFVMVAATTVASLFCFLISALLVCDEILEEPMERYEDMDACDNEDDDVFGPDFVSGSNYAPYSV